MNTPMFYSYFEYANILISHIHHPPSLAWGLVVPWVVWLKSILRNIIGVGEERFVHTDWPFSQNIYETQGKIFTLSKGFFG